MSLSSTGQTIAEEVCYKRVEVPDVLKYANEKRCSEIFDDFTISTTNKRFSTNKLILASCSRYFDIMFRSEMIETYKNNVDIKSIDENSMKSLIDYIYTGNIKINSKNVYDLISASDYLQIDDVKEFCFNFLQSMITPDNCFIMQTIADRHGNDSLKFSALQFVSENFNEVICTDGFKSKSTSELISLISFLDRKLVKESMIYEAIVSWTKHDETNRQSDFSELFKLVQLQQLPSDLLEKVVSEEDLVKGNLACFNVFIKQFCDLAKEMRMKENEGNILCLGGHQKNLKVFEILKKFYPNLLEQRDSGCVVKINDFVYYIGGLGLNEETYRNLWRLNLQESKMKWVELKLMNEKRHLMGATVHDECIYVVGGCDNFSQSTLLSSGEFYSPILNKWVYIPPLQEPRCSLCLVECEGLLYAIGGDDNYGSVSSVECYRPGDEGWKMVSPMQTARQLFGAVNCNGIIYAIGGQSGDEFETALKSCEIYNIADDKWTYISDMKFERSVISVCVFQGKIYVNGRGNASDNQKVIECYDPLTDEWTIAGETDEAYSGHSLVAV